MLRTFLADIPLHQLPIAAMVLFLVLFVLVLLRVSRRARSEAYRRMAHLPLDGPSEQTPEPPCAAPAPARGTGGVR